VLGHSTLIPDESLAVTVLPTALAARRDDGEPLLALDLATDGPQVTLLRILSVSQGDDFSPAFLEAVMHFTI